MIEACHVLEALLETRGRNDKITILKQITANGPLSKKVQFLFQTAFDSYMHYGVGEILDNREYQGDLPSFETLFELRDKLMRREITGNAAREKINQTILCSDELVRKWLIAAFMKNIKCGVAIGTINKVFPGLVREFEVQLCDKLEPDQELPEGNWICEPKYDGLRCFMMFKDNELVEICSRNGKPLYNMDYIGIELAKYIPEGVVDGEAYAVDWNESAGVVRSSKTEKSSASLKFRAFDIVPQMEWDSQKGELTLQERKGLLKSLVTSDVQHTELTEYKPVKNASEAWFYAKEYSKQGYEGSVIKDLNSTYAYKRTRSWLKLKFEHTIDIPIVDFEEGTGRNAGRLGAFICELPNGEKVNVGGGFKDIDRTLFWSIRNEMLGKVIEVKYQEKTAGDASLRFPVFVRVRDDKS